jgi:PAS domain S-box-containing protein
MRDLLAAPSFSWDAKVSIKLLLESAPIAIAVVSQAGALLYVNGKLEEMFGYSREELLGQPVEVLMPERFRQAHVQHRAGYVRTPHMRTMGSALDLAARRKDGSEFPIEAGLSYVHIDDEMVIMATITDISRRKQIKDELELLVDQRTHELERRQEVADGLRDILAMLNSGEKLEAILDRIVQHATGLLAAGACAIFRHQERSRELVVQASCGFPGDEIHDFALPIRKDHLMGHVALSGQPVTIPDLTQPVPPDKAQQEPRRQLLLGYGFRALLAVPLVIKNEVNGCFVLYYPQQRIFDHEEIELAATFSHQAALAIENDRLRSQIERTAVAAERSRLARDLHDAVTQTLFSASMIAEVLPRIWQRSESEGRRRLDELRELTRGALAEMRTLLLELRPTKLLEVEIAELLRQLADGVSGRARVPVTVEIEGDAEIPPDVKVAFYRIAQEALNNVAKHAHATGAQVSLRRTPDLIELAVRDDGVGFEFDTIRPEHLGLGIMRERAEDIGALLAVHSGPDLGTQVTARWLNGHLPAATKPS